MKPIAKPCPCPGLTLPFLLAALMLGLIGPSFAADPDEGAAVPHRWTEVRQFDVAPVQRPAALLAPNAQTPPPPASLETAQRLQILADLAESAAAAAGSGSAGADASLETFVLSAALTVFEDRGELTLVQPYTVHPETGVHMRGSDSGSVGVKIQVKEGSRYLVDFLVRSAVPGEYRLDTEAGSEVIDDASGDREHVLLALNARSSGWTTVRLRRPESDFFLYAVEITRVD